MISTAPSQQAPRARRTIVCDSRAETISSRAAAILSASSIGHLEGERLHVAAAVPPASGDDCRHWQRGESALWILGAPDEPEGARPDLPRPPRDAPERLGNGAGEAVLRRALVAAGGGDVFGG